MELASMSLPYDRDMVREIAGQWEYAVITPKESHAGTMAGTLFLLPLGFLNTPGPFSV